MWQPIETLERKPLPPPNERYLENSGEVVLVTDGRAVTPAYFRWDDGSFADLTSDPYDPWEMVAYQPTHWMPLPEPPQ